MERYPSCTNGRHVVIKIKKRALESKAVAVPVGIGREAFREELVTLLRLHQPQLGQGSFVHEAAWHVVYLVSSEGQPSSAQRKQTETNRCRYCRKEAAVHFITRSGGRHRYGHTRPPAVVVTMGEEERRVTREQDRGAPHLRWRWCWAGTPSPRP